MFDTHKLNIVQVVNDIVSVDCDSRHRVNKVSIVTLSHCHPVVGTGIAGGGGASESPIRNIGARHAWYSKPIQFT